MVLPEQSDFDVAGCYCRNGVSRCGCYCVISIAWDKLREEGVIDIFRAVNMVKMNRPQLVDNLVCIKQPGWYIMPPRCLRTLLVYHVTQVSWNLVSMPCHLCVL